MEENLLNKEEQLEEQSSLEEQYEPYELIELLLKQFEIITAEVEEKEQAIEEAFLEKIQTFHDLVASHLNQIQTWLEGYPSATFLDEQLKKHMRIIISTSKETQKPTAIQCYLEENDIFKIIIFHGDRIILLDYHNAKRLNQDELITNQAVLKELNAIPKEAYQEAARKLIQKSTKEITTKLSQELAKLQQD